MDLDDLLDTLTDIDHAAAAAGWSAIIGHTHTALAHGGLAQVQAGGIAGHGHPGAIRMWVTVRASDPHVAGRLIIGDPQAPGFSGAADGDDVRQRLDAAGRHLDHRLGRPDATGHVLAVATSDLVEAVGDHREKPGRSPARLFHLGWQLLACRLAQAGDRRAADTVAALAVDWSGDLCQLAATVHGLSAPPATTAAC